MKTIKIIAIIALFMGFTSCSKEDDSPIPGNDAVTFEGSFSREFSVQGSAQRVTYSITPNKINYDLVGGFTQANYDTKKEYFSKDDNRWVGLRESNGTYYVIFFKNITDTEVTLYKKEVASLDAGKTEPMPAADNEENHGWNTYKKDLPISGKVENLYAQQLGGHGQPTSGPFAKFDFETGKITTSDTDWDIAFRGTKIILNGGKSSGTTDEPSRNGVAGAYIAAGTLKEVTSVDTSLFVQDSEAGFAISGWYSYNSTTHVITAVAGKILVIKTRDGKYAKVEILSYYKDANTSNDARYYTFNYVYQPKEGLTTF